MALHLGVVLDSVEVCSVFPHELARFGIPLTTLALEEQIHEESLWFGTADRPLFGRLTTPVGEMTKGGVLLAPPIGRETRLARRALRTLAIYLAVDGYVSLRYDHFGAGDSSGSIEDVELIRAWLEGVDEGVGLLRSLGISSISGVGMRMGATIMGTAASANDLGLSSFVMWDPCESGRAYVREMIALGALGPDTVTAGSGGPTRMLEYAMSDDAEKRLEHFSLVEPTTRRVAERVLVVTRDDRAVSSKFRSRWDSDYVAWETTSEQGPLLELLLPVSVPPTSTIATIRGWLTASPSLPVPFTVQPGSLGAIVSRESDSYPVRESVMALGSNEMFVMVSEPVGESNGPTIVMVNGVNEDHLGPARLWVELSRRWASLGLRCVRFDLSELGESRWLPSQPDRPVFDKTRRHDIVDVLRTLDPAKPGDSVLIGYCSGAQLALEVAQELKTRGVCVINPEVGAGAIPNVDRLKLSGSESTRSFVQRAELFLTRHRRADKMVRDISRLALSSTYPPKIAPELVKSGSEILLLLSPDDLSPFRRVPFLGRALRRRLISSGNFHVEIVPGLDHAILSTAGRSRAVAILDAFVVERYAPTSSSVESREEDY